MIKLTMIQADKYGDKEITTDVASFDDADRAAALFRVEDKDIEIIFRLPAKKEGDNDPV